jgi:alkylation response protein AidB-like acyl-CoA dehydrogenase
MHCLASLSPAERAFRDEVRAFLAAELDAALVAAEDRQRTFVAHHERGNLWIDKLRARRWHVGHWPAAHGGGGLTPTQNYILQYEQGLAGAPAAPPMGLAYVGPTVIRFGSPAQQARVLPALIAGRDHWCQGFSEPGAGSDLARVATFAERRDERYVINGSKIWTTDAQHSNKIFLLLRTRRDDSRQAMSFFLLDMATPGVTVRPIRMLTGDHEFNQVFFDDVEVSSDELLGAEGEGWDIARYLLEIERGSFVFGGRLRRRLALLEQVARAQGAGALLTARLARLARDLLAYEHTELRLGTLALGGAMQGAAANLIKIEWTELLQRLDEVSVELAGPDALHGDDTPLAAGELGMPSWLAAYFNNLAATIYGGSNEVQRNLVFRTMRKVWG